MGHPTSQVAKKMGVLDRIEHAGEAAYPKKNASTTQRSLFPDAEQERPTRLDEVADRIKDKFGQCGLQRALGMPHDVEHRERRPGADRNPYDH